MVWQVRPALFEYGKEVRKCCHGKLTRAISNSWEVSLAGFGRVQQVDYERPPAALAAFPTESALAAGSGIGFIADSRQVSLTVNKES
jgi:hypothetical protein